MRTDHSHFGRALVSLGLYLALLITRLSRRLTWSISYATEDYTLAALLL